MSNRMGYSPCNVTFSCLVAVISLEQWDGLSKGLFYHYKETWLAGMMMTMPHLGLLVDWCYTDTLRIQRLYGPVRFLVWALLRLRPFA